MQFNFKFTYEQSLHVDIICCLKEYKYMEGIGFKISFPVELWFSRK